MNETVLVVDDEERIRSALRGILSDEGFRVVDTGHAPGVMDLIARESPRSFCSTCGCPKWTASSCCGGSIRTAPRAGDHDFRPRQWIQSAVAATKLGAADFIQKPFSVSGLLASIARALDGDSAGPDPSNARGLSAQLRAAGREAIRAGAIPQRTVARSIVTGGQGLHSGLKTGVILHPAPPGFG